VADLVAKLVDASANGDSLALKPRSRFSGNWAKDNVRRGAAQNAEQQRIADFYARQTQQ
jgi:hypothetical protein